VDQIITYKDERDEGKFEGGQIYVEEVRLQIQISKNNTSPGLTGITYEILKLFDKKTIRSWLFCLI
jgi:hypothetical protein